MNAKLKPCPFCGSEDVEISTGYDLYGVTHYDYVQCQNCAADGPWQDDERGTKWNAAIRKDELLELLRLVREVTDWENDLIDTNEFSEDGEAMINDIGRLREYAAKLRKEMGE